MTKKNKMRVNANQQRGPNNWKAIIQTKTGGKNVLKCIVTTNQIKSPPITACQGSHAKGQVKSE